MKKVNTHEGQRDVRENEETIKKMEVQEITFNYFAQSQSRDLNFFYLLWVYGMA